MLAVVLIAMFYLRNKYATFVNVKFVILKKKFSGSSEFGFTLNSAVNFHCTHFAIRNF